jgi:hypothetical protein
MKIFLFFYFFVNSISFRKYTIVKRINSINETLYGMKNKKQNITKIEFTDEHMKRALLLF